MTDAQTAALRRPALGTVLFVLLCGSLFPPFLMAQSRGRPTSSQDEMLSAASDDSLAPDLKTPSMFRRPSASSPELQLLQAEALERSGRVRSARRAYNALVHQWHASPEAPRAQLGVARMRERAGDRMRAFREYQYAIDNFSGHFPYEFAVERQFAIADELLSELGRGFLGFGREAGTEQVVQLFRRVAGNAPSGARAPVCYLKMGLTYEADKRFEEAVTPYEMLVARFPKHELVSDAMFRAAHCRYRMARKSPRDERTLRNAMSALSSVRRDFPRHPGLPELEAWLGELRSDFLRMQFEQAAFYDRVRKDPRGALVAYGEFVRRFESWGEPAESAVAAARARMEDLQRKTRETPSSHHDGETP